MIQLPNQCRCSKPSVYPSNWDKSGASIRKKWYIQYYFYDPLFKDQHPNGKFIVIKKGINYAHSLPERRAAVKIVLKQLMYQLTNEGFNPITNKFTPPTDVSEYEISPDLPVLDAFNRALKRSELSHESKVNIKSTLKYFSVAVHQLNYDQIAISDVRRKHIRFALEHCAKVKKYWSNSLFNNYRRDISMLFAELIRTETVEYNPVDKIEKKKTVKKLRQTLSPDDRQLVNNHLFANHYTFWRFTQIFFHSGARVAELMNVRKCDVDLENQEFKVTIKKGNSIFEATKIIKDIALPLWQEIMNEANDNEYLFSKDLRPGIIHISSRQVTIRWKRHVKDRLGITADFYSLKHLNTTEVTEIAGETAAAKLNSHITTKMVKEVYDVNNKSRRNTLLKSIKNVFA